MQQLFIDFLKTIRVFKLCLMGTILLFSSLNFSINAYASDFKKNSEKFAKGFSVADSKSLFGGTDMRGRASNNSPFCAIEKRKWRAREENLPPRWPETSMTLPPKIEYGKSNVRPFV